MRLRIAADPHSAKWYVLLQLHHLVTDHVAQEQVVAEVRSLLAGFAQALPAPVAYRGFVGEALWQAQQQDAEGYFRNKLGTIDEPTTPFGLVDVYGDGSEIEEHGQAVEAALALRVRRAARRLGVSCATLFHAAWGLVVGSTSAREDVVFGSVLSGRMQGNEGADRVLGMFINTLPMRLQLG